MDSAQSIIDSTVTSSQPITSNSTLIHRNSNESCHVDDICDDLLQHIFSYTSVWDLRHAICTCKKWKDNITDDDRGMIVVSASGTNEIILMRTSNGEILQRLKASSIDNNRRKRRRYSSGRSMIRNTWCWPTCLAWDCNDSDTNTIESKQSSLFVSQYKVAGILEFKRQNPSCTLRVRKKIMNNKVKLRRQQPPLRYRRTLVSEQPQFNSPEGLVCARNNLYVISVENGTVLRLKTTEVSSSNSTSANASATTTTSQMLQEVAKHNRSDEDFYVLWGMCMNHNRSRLYVAAHVHDGEDNDGNYRYPTRTNTGKIFFLDLETDGSFQKQKQKHEEIHDSSMIDTESSSSCPYGYFDVAQQHLDNNRLNHVNDFFHWNLNRPSNPAFCRHGILHISSFISFQTGTKRLIYKFDVGISNNNGAFLNHNIDQEYNKVGKNYEEKSAKSSTKISSSSSFPHRQQPKLVGWIEAERLEDKQNLSQPWGIAFSTNKNNLYVTTHASSNDDKEGYQGRKPAVLKLDSCGCDTSLNTKKSSPRPYYCGRVTVLATSDALELTNYVLPV